LRCICIIAYSATVLGFLYGLIPGLVVVLRGVLVHRVMTGIWVVVGFVMAAAMVGLVVGGLLDRLTEAALARKKLPPADADPERSDPIQSDV